MTDVRWKVSLLEDQENGTVVVVVVVTGSWEVKESELLLLNHEKCGRQMLKENLPADR